MKVSTSSGTDAYQNSQSVVNTNLPLGSKWNPYTDDNIPKDKTPEEKLRDDKYIQFYIAHRSGPYESADNASTIIQRELKKTTSELEKSRPALASKDWDFTMKDGALVSTGKTLSAADHALLDKQLNANTALVDAVKTLSQAAVQYLQTSDDNPSYISNNITTGLIQNYTYDNVAEQMNGKTQFKDWMAKIDNYAHPNANANVEVSKGPVVLDILSLMLKSSPAPTYTVN